MDYSHLEDLVARALSTGTMTPAEAHRQTVNGTLPGLDGPVPIARRTFYRLAKRAKVKVKPRFPGKVPGWFIDRLAQVDQERADRLSEAAGADGLKGPNYQAFCRHIEQLHDPSKPVPVAPEPVSAPSREAHYPSEATMRRLGVSIPSVDPDEPQTPGESRRAALLAQLEDQVADLD